LSVGRGSDGSTGQEASRACRVLALDRVMKAEMIFARSLPISTCCSHWVSNRHGSETGGERSASSCIRVPGGGYHPTQFIPELECTEEPSLVLYQGAAQSTGVLLSAERSSLVSPHLQIRVERGNRDLQ